jgi:Transposase DDE domain group 1
MRLSCHRFRANEVRLWLSLIAYNLGNLLRGLALRAREGMALGVRFLDASKSR